MYKTKKYLTLDERLFPLHNKKYNMGMPGNYLGGLELTTQYF